MWALSRLKARRSIGSSAPEELFCGRVNEKIDRRQSFAVQQQQQQQQLVVRQSLLVAAAAVHANTLRSSCELCLCCVRSTSDCFQRHLPVIILLELAFLERD